MTFGERIRRLRKAKNLNQSELAGKVGINFTYLARSRTTRLTSSEFPSEDTIKKLAKAPRADADELLLMARKVPDSIKKRVIDTPTPSARLRPGRQNHRQAARRTRWGRMNKQPRRAEVYGGGDNPTT